MRVADDRAGDKPPRYSPLGSKRHCLDASRQPGPQLVMPAKAGIHLGVHGNSDPKSGGQAPALRGHMRVSPTLQLCPGERSERLSQERPAVTRTCPINTSLCVNLPFDRLRACPVPRYSVSTRYGGERNRQESVRGSWFVVRGSWFVVRGSWFVVRGSWFVVRGSWFVVRGSWFVVRGSWFVVRGSCSWFVLPLSKHESAIESIYETATKQNHYSSGWKAFGRRPGMRFLPSV